MDTLEERTAFHFELGHGITQWAHVESALGVIAAHRFSKPNYNLALTGFLSIENFRSKLQYVDAIVQQHGLPDDEKKNWATLKDRCLRVSKKRNNLAHKWVIENASGKSGRRLLLVGSLSALNPPKSRKKRYAGAIGLRDVAGYRSDFFALMAELANFDARLSGRKEPFPKFLTQPRRPPTIPQIRKEFREGASHLLPPSPK